MYVHEGKSLCITVLHQYDQIVLVLENLVGDDFKKIAIKYNDWRLIMEDWMQDFAQQRPLQAGVVMAW